MRLMFVGDINLGEYYTSFGHGPATYLKSRNVFSEVQSLFDTADIVVGNLEAPLTNANLDPLDPESMVLRGAPESAETLSKAGFRVLQVANNHTMQHGESGFVETINSLRNQGIIPVGLKDQNVQKIEVNGVTAGFLAASDVPDNTIPEQNQYQPLNQDFIEKCKASVDIVDHLFVLLHWGKEESTSPLPYQYEIIDQLHNSGVRGIIGSHPHLFYKVWKKGSFIAAPSLGNFVFDLCWEGRLSKSGILELYIEGNETQAMVTPVNLKSNGCLPTPSAARIHIENEISLYNLGNNTKTRQLNKLLYFAKNFHKGDKYLKSRFFIRKFAPALKPTRHLS